MRLGILASHPIQYQAPFFRALAKEMDVHVYFAHKITREEQGQAGFGVNFDWDIDLLQGYAHTFLENKSRYPNASRVFGCDTPGIHDLLKQQSLDAFIINGWHLKCYWQAMGACRRLNIPILIRGDSQLLTPRNLLKRWIKYPLYRYFLPRFDGYLVVGERARQYYIHYGVDARRMFFVPHAVDNDFFHRSAVHLYPKRDQIKTAFGISGDWIVFLFAGKLIEVKRPMDFIRAIARAHKFNKKVHGLIVGDGPLRISMEERVKKENLPVTFTGFLNQTEMPNAYAVSDLLVLSSKSETWGLVVNEAMASGLPAIVSDQAGCAPDLIDFEKTGAVFQLGDTEELARLFDHFAKNRDLVERMKKNVLSVIKNYSVHEAVKGTLKAVCAVKSNSLN